MKTGLIELENDEALTQEVKRALNFMIDQKGRGISIEDSLQQIKGSYGQRVHYFVALSISRRLKKDKRVIIKD